MVDSPVMSGKERFLWLPSVVGRTCVFLFLFTLLCISLFLLGNFQDFLDSTQVFLLHLFEISSVAFVMASLYYIGVLIVLASRGRRLQTLRLVLAAAGVVAFSALYALVRFFLAWL